MIIVNEIKLGLEEELSRLPKKVAKKLRCKETEIQSYQILKESIDARDKKDIQFVYQLGVVLAGEKTLPASTLEQIAPRPERPLIVGFGPCGMFAALRLIELGYQPIVIERGKPVAERVKDVARFWEEGILDFESNVQFGEGGAGTFSDGKLTTQIKDKRIKKVLETFVAAGADEKIRYKQKPHIGTDQLRIVVENIRKQILASGGEIHFQTKLKKLQIENGTLTGAEIENGNGMIRSIKANHLILAAGHSARDTLETLYEQAVAMAQKPFSVGVRIEHPRDMIDKCQYGDAAGHPRLGAADYKLSYRCENGRGVYTFCMCPGGLVVGAASEPGGVVTNGMSYHARNAVNSNSALLVSVETEDFESDHPLAGIDFQRKLEQKAFKMGGNRYFAPAQRIGDFLGTEAKEGVTPSYQPGVVWCEMETLFPPFIIEAIKEALPNLARKIRGFDRPDGILTGPETRSSSPVRILRNAQGESISVTGLYPAGEGAGYAGGIVSAAIDGIKAADAVNHNILERSQER